MLQTRELRGRVLSAFALVALFGSACSDAVGSSSEQGDGLHASQQTAATDGHSTILVESMELHSTASLRLNTSQLNGSAERSLAYYTKLDDIELWFSISPFPEETTQAPIPDLVTGALSANGSVRAFSTGAASVTKNGEVWTVRLEGTAVGAMQGETALDLTVTGTIDRQCFVEGEPQTPQATSQDGRSPTPELVLDREWSTSFCQAQLP